MRYELILFDLDNTLLDYDQAERSALKNALVQFGITNNFSHYHHDYNRINMTFWQKFENQEISVEQLRVERFQELFLLNKLTIHAENFSNIYLRFLAKTDFLLPGAIEISEYCGKKYKIALISNGLASVQYSRIQKSGLGEYFDSVTISEEVGYPKPHPEIFASAIQSSHHTDRRTILMVGDNLPSDIKGGIDFGIDTCWINWANQENLTTFLPTYELTDLMRLKRII